MRGIKVTLRHRTQRSACIHFPRAHWQRQRQWRASVRYSRLKASANSLWGRGEPLSASFGVRIPERNKISVVDRLSHVPRTDEQYYPLEEIRGIQIQNSLRTFAVAHGDHLALNFSLCSPKEVKLRTINTHIHKSCTFGLHCSIGRFRALHIGEAIPIGPTGNAWCAHS